MNEQIPRTFIQGKRRFAMGPLDFGRSI
jgi:hypothetical protein